MNTLDKVRIDNAPQEMGLIRVPTYLYQIMADAIGQTAVLNWDKDINRWVQVGVDHKEMTASQQRIMNLLVEWIDRDYPGKEVNAVIDLSIKDLGALQSKGTYGFTWGMWIQLRDKGSLEQLPGIQHLLTR